MLPAWHWGFVALIPYCIDGRCPEKGSGRKRAADSWEAPGMGPLVEAAAGMCVPCLVSASLPVSVCGSLVLCSEPQHPLPICPVTFSHMCCCCLEVLFP